MSEASTPEGHISAAEAGQRIGRSEKTIRHWIARGWLPAEKVTSTHGPAEWSIDGEELLRVATERAKVRASSPTAGDLAARVAHLEATIEGLRQRAPYLFREGAPTTRYGANLSDGATAMRGNPPRAPGGAETHAETHPRRAVVTQRLDGGMGGGDLPGDLVGWRAMCRAHGVPETTAQKAIDGGRLRVVTGRWSVGRAVVRSALDAGGRARFHALWAHRLAGWHDCPDCPHDGGEMPSAPLSSPAPAE